ncbi:hypothetical protein D9V86_08680 [Bacteroidetes/Chlorobi group bacterium ChocPot_Mid]|nr:MAG: hypothetical protein D9V86_08680 [Bacteroidetes/Chlorobi group bacterium ChocPot_Mid]
MKNMIKIILIIFATLCIVEISAQTKANVLLQGKVIDITSGKPIGTSLYFINSKGKPALCLSNSLDGSYQQSLPSGEIYYVIAKGYLPENNELKIDLSTIMKYEEINTNIFIKPFQSNLEIFRFKFFEPNDSVVINKQFIQFIKTFVNFNPEIKLNIIVSSYDSWLENSKRRIEKIDKKGKVTYKNENYTTKERLSDLLDSRINNLRNELKDYQVVFKRDVFIKNLQVVPLSKKQMKKSISGKSNKAEIYTPDFDNVRIVTANK